MSVRLPSVFDPARAYRRVTPARLRQILHSSQPRPSRSTEREVVCPVAGVASMRPDANYAESIPPTLRRDFRST
ncbi:hypothetical protein BKA93DRAFT_334978 [Sparassis latifolia]